MHTIAQISDLHFGRHSVAVKNDLIHSLAENRPDLVVVSGDFTQRARRSEFAEAREFLDLIVPPKLVVPGNHDLPLYNLAGRLLRPFENYDRYISPVDQPAGFYNDGKLAVLGLNTARRFTRKNGRISLDQIARVRDIFSGAPTDAFKAVVTHHPFANSAIESALELAGRSSLALTALAAAGVQLLMSGHHHLASSGHWTVVSANSSILVVHAGTAISSRLRGGEGNTYNLVHILPGDVSVHVMEWRSGLGFQIAKVSRHTFDGALWKREDEERPSV